MAGNQASRGRLPLRALFRPRRKMMSPKVSEEDRPTEDDLARQKLGPRGVPGEPDTAKMTPQRRKKTPEVGDFDGHTAYGMARKI
jgi:hypothetical protein